MPGTRKKNKQKKKSEERDETKSLSEVERQVIVRNILLQLASLENPSPRVRWEAMESIKKLKIMLSLFASHGKEFDTNLPLPQLEDRYIEVRLRNVKGRQSTVVIRHGEIPDNSH